MKSLEDPQGSGEGNEVSRPNDGRCFECHQCGRVFKKKSSIVCHMRLHTGEKPFACTLCDSRFTHKSTLLHHTWLHTGEKPYECEVCHKKFRQRPHYTLHKKIHTNEKSFECPVCGKQFAQRVHLTTHNRLHTGEKPFACKECDKKFFQRCHLSRHQKMHIGQKLLEYSESDRFPCSTRLDSPTFVQNDQRFVQNGALLKRDEVIVDVSNISSGMDKKQSVFECDECSKTFRRKANLRYHISTHTGEKPFECTECGKKYCERRSVSRHIQKVHEDINAACQHPRGRKLFLVEAIPCQCGRRTVISQHTPSLKQEERQASIFDPETPTASDGEEVVSPGLEECTGGASDGQEVVSPGLEECTGGASDGQEVVSPGLEECTGGASDGQEVVSPGLEECTGDASDGQEVVSLGLEECTGGASDGQEVVSPGLDECTGATSTAAPSRVSGGGRWVLQEETRRTPSTFHPNRTQTIDFSDQTPVGDATWLAQEMDRSETETSTRSPGRWTPYLHATHHKEGRLGDQHEDEIRSSYSLQTSTTRVPQPVHENSAAHDTLSLAGDKRTRISLQLEFDSMERAVGPSLSLTHRGRPISEGDRGDKGCHLTRPSGCHGRPQVANRLATLSVRRRRSTQTRKMGSFWQQTLVCPGPSQVSVDLCFPSQPGAPRLEDEVTLKEEIDIVEEDL